MKKIVSFIIILVIIFQIISYIYIPSKSMALSQTYTQSLKKGIENFPASYQSYLKKLQEMHPNWIFKAYYTGIDWSEVTSNEAENACLKNTIRKIDLMDPSMLCICGRTGDPGYYCASSKTVNYYLDPRNSLTENSVYQFLDLSNTTTISKEVIKEVVKGTYLNNDIYINAIIEAANQSGVGVLPIITTIFQELGKKSELPRAISGTVPGYEGLYNFYNYGASDGDGAVERGLEKAREMGWTDPTFAMVDGAIKVLRNGYIDQGQITKYFYKFDVVGNEILQEDATKTYYASYFYNHQYMTNVQDPSSQAGMLMEYYTNNRLTDSSLVFTIPIYNNMPETPASFPTTLTASDGELYYVNTVHVSSLNVRDESGNIIGKLTKGQIVAVESIQNNVARIKLKVATGIGLDENGKARWNYEDKIVILNDARYLIKCENQQTPALPTEEIKIDGTNIKMIPSVTVNTIKQTYPNATIIKPDGTDITTTDELVGTGYKVVIDGIEYTAIKYGDCNGDGKIKASDYVLIKNLIMSGQSIFNEAQTMGADVNKDGSIKASDYVLIKNYIMTGAQITL